MKKIFIAMMLTLFSVKLYSQKTGMDSAEVIYKGKIGYIRYSEINDMETGLMLIKKMHPPLYIFNSKNFTVASDYFRLNESTVKNCDSLISFYIVKDSLDSCRIQTMQFVIDQSNQRIENFKSGYEEATKINHDLSTMLTESLQLTRDELKSARRGKFKGVIWGFLGGALVGTYIGFQAVQK